ncbi:MAG: hypothetical protein R6X31_02005 [Anaerolineae bacterium]
MENQEEQVTQEDQGTDRAFITLVAVLGGLLVLGIGAFVAWALLIAPNMRANIESQNEAIFATNTAIAIAAAATETAAVTPTPTNTPVPTDTPIPTDTPTPPPPSNTPTPEATATLALGTPSAGGESGSVSKGMPDTGIGVLGGAALAGGLAFLMILVRRLRSTT